MADLAASTTSCLQPWLNEAHRGDVTMSSLIYLHGFNSSPQSHKATVLGKWLTERGLAGSYCCPALPPRADQAIALVEAEIARRTGQITFVGSSLGGFYATWLAEKYDARAVLINPAITPHVGLSQYIGVQQNLYTGEQYLLTDAHVQEWARLWCPSITPSRYLLMVETGDEVLDYREAVARYAGAEQIVVQGGDHMFQSFPEHIPRLLEFAGLTG
jgi:predicted esterase YcpF (UPF0227 family)